MKIEGNTIIFRSAPQNYFKERENHKCNTVIRLTQWSEMKAFERFRDEFNFNAPNKQIRIFCDGEGFFERTITDITPFECVYIISWMPEARRVA